MKAQGKDSLITWLQQILLEACYVKLNGGQMVTSNEATVEPTAYYFNRKSHFAKYFPVRVQVPPIAYSSELYFAIFF